MKKLFVLNITNRGDLKLIPAEIVMNEKEGFKKVDNNLYERDNMYYIITAVEEKYLKK